MRAAPFVRPLLAIALIAAIAFIAIVTIRDTARRHPERLPWTPLSLARPIGPFTATKLAMLGDDTPRCLALLANAGIDYRALPPPGTPAAGCGYTDGVTIRPGTNAAWRPAAPKIACPVAAALHIWERDIVAPAAQRHLGQPLAGIDHLGSFNCRRIAGSSNWSEHATADAIDIAGFRLENGDRISVLADWNGTPAKARFLRAVRDGACDLFATTLSPDYNRAHADHFHLDQAARGALGGSVCR
jgi:hypothetical protein